MDRTAMMGMGRERSELGWVVMGMDMIAVMGMAWDGQDFQDDFGPGWTGMRHAP